MLVNVWARRRVYLTGLCLLLCSLTAWAQLVDVNACQGNLLRCVTEADTAYEMCFKVIPASICAYSRFTIDWGDNTPTETKNGPGPVEVRHTYRLNTGGSLCAVGGVRKYTIKVETNCPGDNITRTLVFLVKPVIRLSVPDACEGRSVRFSNNTCPSSSDINNDITYRWNFGDGSTSTSVSPSHIFPQTQPSFPVSLTATNQCGTATTQLNIPIRKTPEAKYITTGQQFMAHDTTGVCLNNGGLLTMDATTSIDATRYSWTITPANYRFVDNTTSVSGRIKVQFTRSGTYTITLTGINDCGVSTPVVCQHRAVDLPAVGLTAQPDLCQDGTYTLKGITPGASYSLNGSAITSGQAISVPVRNTPYIVTGSAGNECGIRTVADTFLVQTPQAVQITLPGSQTAVCAGTTRFGLPVNLGGGFWEGTGKAFVETSGNSFFFNPRTIGRYTLIYNRGSGACSRSDTVRVLVEGGQPTVQNVSVCGSETFVKLRGDPSGGTGTWSSAASPGAVRGDTLFLAGITATQVQVTYQVRYGVSGCLSTTTATVTIGRPKSLFTITGACSNLAPQVQNQSTGGTVFEWTLNGRPVPAVGLPVFTLAPGVNQIQLKVGAGTCSDLSTQTLVVVAPPAPVTITPTFVSDCSPMRVTFTPSGTPSPDVQYAWELGNGQRSAVFAPPLQLYTNAGRLPQPVSVSLTASNGCGRQNATVSLMVRPLARAEIGVDSTLVRCTPASIRFANRSTGQSGSTWLFGDGSAPLVSAADTLSHVFSARDSSRTYSVQLIVSSQCGRDTSRVRIRVVPTLVRPLVTISNATPCPGEQVTFTDATTPKPVRVIWRLTNGSTQVTPVASWTFSQPSTTYTISMTALTECGFDSTRRTIRTTTAPTGSFSATPGLTCVGQPVQFANGTNPAIRFLWSFGDGSPLDSVTYAPTHRYAQPGSFNLSLTLFGGASGSCRVVLPGMVTVRPRPVAAIQFVGDSLQCLPGKIGLQAGATAGATDWYWRLSDGRTFGGAAVDVPLLQAGTFTVSMTVSSGIAGCADSTQRQGSLQAINCEVQAPGVFTPNHDGVGEGWTLFGMGILRINILRVRSRWGEVIYEGLNLPASSLKPGECWDGTFNGTPMPAGSYTYEADVLLRGNRSERRVGSVELRR